MNSSTITTTYTKTDVQNVLEHFGADLIMLARRTQAMDVNYAQKIFIDICTMVIEECLSEVHIQLFDAYGKRVRAHKYNIHHDVNWSSQRPGQNRWPCLPNGQLIVIVQYTNLTSWQQLINSGKLNENWNTTNLDIQYTEMQLTANRRYASSNYGWNRSSYSSY